jgi:hypothetical protein
VTFLSAGIATSISMHVSYFLFLIIISVCMYPFIIIIIIIIILVVVLLTHHVISLYDVIILMYNLFRGLHFNFVLRPNST